MASNGNQPSHANSAGASYQLAQHTPFTSQPYLPQLMHNLTVPASEFHQNRSNDRVLSSQHSTPRTFFTPPTTQLLQSIAGPAQDYQNHSDYRQQSSQVGRLQDTDIRTNAGSSMIRSENQPSINHYNESDSTVRNVLLRNPDGNQPTLDNNSRRTLRNERYHLETEILFAPRTFFAPLPQPTTQLSRNIADPAPDFQQNISDNQMLSSQVAALIDDYESRIRALNQDICHLKSLEEQNLFYLGANCAKLNDELLKKDSELEAFKALNGLLESQSLALAQEKRDFEAHCTKLKDELNEKDSELKVSHDLLKSQALAHGQEKKNFEAQCAKLKDELNEKDSELKASHDLLDLHTLSFGQEKRDLEAQCTKLSDELLEKDSELEALKQFKAAALKDPAVTESRIRELNQEISHLKSSEQEKLFYLGAHCSKLNDELLKKNSELEALNDLWKDQERKRCDLQKKLGKMEVDRRDILRRVKRYKDKFLRTQKEKSILMKKKRISEDSFRSHSFQISQLQRNNKKLRDEYEMLKTNLKADLDASKSRVQNLQAELNQISAKLLHSNHKLSKVEEENGELKLTNERITRESEQKLIQFNQMVSENEAFAKLSEIVAGLERNLDRQMKDNSLQLSELIDKNKKLEEENEMLKANPTGDNERSCAELQKTRQDMNNIVAERDHLKSDLTTANETIKVSVERSAKVGLKLKVQEEKCKEQIAEIDKLKQDLAQSLNLKGELEHAKKNNEQLSGKNKEFEKEAKRFLNRFFVSSNDEQGSSEEKNEDENSGPTPKKKKPNNFE